MHWFVKSIDWFIPASFRYERSELGLARVFVFTHLFGPLISQSIIFFLYQSDPHGGWPLWIICACVWSFWLLPFLLKYSGDLYLSATLSVITLSFVSLFGTFFYGGSSSPFLPWLIVSLLLGFFYLTKRPAVIFFIFTANLTVFFSAYIIFGFLPRVAREELTTVSWISILAATVYMAWMAIYYAGMLSMRSELVREIEQHRGTMTQLREAKRSADEANRARSIFLAKMSHEFRTPLNAVIGYSELVMENLKNEVKSPQKKTDLLRINAAGKHLLSLLTDVLDMSRIENDEIDINIRTFDLNEFIADVVATTSSLAGQNGNRLIVICPPGAGSISTDDTKLRQAALNLISNAAKFTRNGVITLSLSREKNVIGDWIEIQVTDTGIGIASADIGKLFTNFRQASYSTASQYGGTGLGLAHSQKLCGLLGGRISVSSDAGKGSAFTIRIPASLTSIDHSIKKSARPASNSPALATAGGEI